MRRDARMQRLAGILVLAALVVAAATLFGSEFAPEAMHEETAEEADHSEAGKGEEEEEEDEEETSVGQVASALLISIGAIALVPLTAPLARRRKPEEDIARTEPRLASALGVDLALLSIGAAVIHFAVIAQHINEWWLSGTFFVLVALFQLAWAVAVLGRPSQPLYLIGAVVNALVVITWIVSRTVGIPVGPEAGEPESIGLADVLATSYEVLLVAVGSALALQVPAAGHLLRPLSAATGTWITAVAVAALTALTLALLP